MRACMTAGLRRG